MNKPFTLLIAAFMLLATACSKDNKTPNYKINSETVVTNYDKEFQFTVEGNPANIAWSSSDERVGKIDDSGLFKASKIGTTTIIGKIGSATIKSEVTVESYDEFFKEPILDYDGKIAAIKDKETREIIYDEDETLIYRGESSQVDQVRYTFDSKSGGLIFPNVSFKRNEDVNQNALTFYLERYDLLASPPKDNIIEGFRFGWYVFENEGSYVTLNADADFAMYSKVDAESTKDIQRIIDMMNSAK